MQVMISKASKAMSLIDDTAPKFRQVINPVGLSYAISRAPGRR